MRTDWRRLVTLKEIETPVSINALKAQRKKLKPVVKKYLKAQDEAFVGYGFELKMLNALIAGKQFLFHSKYSQIKKFSWSMLTKSARARR